MGIGGVDTFLVGESPGSVLQSEDKCVVRVPHHFDLRQKFFILLGFGS